jgi:hypothetical protein
MKVPVTSVTEYLSYQMFTKKKHGASKEGLVSILSERPVRKDGDTQVSNKQRLN